MFSIPFLILLVVASSAGAETAGALTSDGLRQLVTDAVATSIHDSGRDQRVHVDPLSPQLKLRDCREPPAVSVPDTLNFGRHSAEVSCSGPVAWRVRVPFEIREWAEVVVTVRPLPRGATISAADVETARRELSFRNRDAVRDPLAAIGNRTSRALPSGTVMEAAHLDRPLLVERGQLVTLLAVDGSIEIVTEGKALSDGRLGDRVPVENVRSGRRLTGTVVASGRVRIDG